MVGAGGLGLILNEKIGWREYASVGMILLALFVTVFIIETISGPPGNGWYRRRCHEQTNRSGL